MTGLPDLEAMAGPGEVLRHRLRAAEPPAWVAGLVLVFFGAFVLMWFGFVTAFTFLFNKHPGGGPPLWAVAPFWLVGVGLAALWLYTALRLAAGASVGALAAEVSAHPVRPGARLEVWAGGAGGGPFAGCTAEVTCTERATYNYATSSTTHTRVVRRLPVDAPPADDPSAGVRGWVAVPADAMHTFASRNNAVGWAVEVRTVAWGWFPVTTPFPFAVLPAEDTR